MKATATVTATAGSDGTRFTTLRSSPPLSLRSTPDALYLVGSGAGPIGGDELAINAVVEKDAVVDVRSAAASIALPGIDGTPSSMTVRARVAGSLSWCPEPTVLVSGCDHRASVHVDLAMHGRLWWRDEVVLGRHDEPSGSLLQRVHIARDGRPLLRTELPVGPRWPGSSGPAGLDGARAVGSIVAVGMGEPGPPRHTPEVRAAVVRLSDDAWLVTAIAASAPALQRFLHGVTVAPRATFPASAVAADSGRSHRAPVNRVD